MSHEIDAFGHIGAPAWHSLGIKLPDGINAEDGFRLSGVGWDTEVHPVPPLTLPDGRIVTAPDHRLHIRSDTASLLGIVGKDYTPVSNMELASFADTLADVDRGCLLETVGSLRGGKRVFALCRLPLETRVTNDDLLRNYVLLSNGHDGLNSFRIFPTAIRVVCANTLAYAESAAGRNAGVRFCHTGNVVGKMEEARRVLGIMTQSATLFADRAQHLASIPFTTDTLAAYFSSVYAAAFPDPPEKKDHNLDTFNLWVANLTDAANAVTSSNGTAWQAFNAITYWADHQRGRLSEVEPGSARVHSNLFGVSSELKKKALSLAFSTFTA